MIQKTIFSLLLLSIIAGCQAKADKPGNGIEKTTTSTASTTPDTVKATRPMPANTVYEQDDVSRVELILKDAATKAKTEQAGSVALWIGRQMRGIPYVGHTLDRTDDERLVVNTRELDCTTFVENVAALTLCAFRGETSFADYVAQLCKIRYRQGKLSYANRLHYYQWWVADNEQMGFVSEVDSPVPPFTATQTLKINFMSVNYRSYDMLRHHPERVRALKTIEDETNGTRVRYIPKTAVKNTQLLRNTIHDGDIIAIVTRKKNLDTSHLGIAVWHRDGLHLLNASSIHHKVVEEPMTLYRYLQKHPASIGIRVARITPSKK